MITKTSAAWLKDSQEFTNKKNEAWSRKLIIIKSTTLNMTLIITYPLHWSLLSFLTTKSPRCWKTQHFKESKMKNRVRTYHAEVWKYRVQNRHLLLTFKKEPKKRTTILNDNVRKFQPASLQQPMCLPMNWSRCIKCIQTAANGNGSQFIAAFQRIPVPLETNTRKYWAIEKAVAGCHGLRNGCQTGGSRDINIPQTFLFVLRPFSICNCYWSTDGFAKKEPIFYDAFSVKEHP